MIIIVHISQTHIIFNSDHYTSVIQTQMMFVRLKLFKVVIQTNTKVGMMNVSKRQWFKQFRFVEDVNVLYSVFT